MYLRSLWNTLQQASELNGRWYVCLDMEPGKEVECMIYYIRKDIEEYERNLRCRCP